MQVVSALRETLKAYMRNTKFFARSEESVLFVLEDKEGTASQSWNLTFTL